MKVANRCCLCEDEEETIDHLLIHYKIVRMLWDLFLTIVGTNWVIHTLLAWQRAHVGKKTKKNMDGCSIMPFLDFMAEKK